MRRGRCREFGAAGDIDIQVRRNIAAASLVASSDGDDLQLGPSYGQAGRRIAALYA